MHYFGKRNEYVTYVVLSCLVLSTICLAQHTGSTNINTLEMPRQIIFNTNMNNALERLDLSFNHRYNELCFIEIEKRMK